MIHTEPHATYDADGHCLRIHPLLGTLIAFHGPHLLHRIFIQKFIKGLLEKQHRNENAVSKGCPFTFLKTHWETKPLSAERHALKWEDPSGRNGIEE
jgi:hypothetical protein